MNNQVSKGVFVKVLFLLLVILILAGVIYVIIDNSALGVIIGFALSCIFFDAVLVVLFFELYYFITEKISTSISIFKYILAGAGVGLIEMVSFCIYFINVIIPESHDVEGAIIVIYTPVLIIFSILGSFLAAYFDKVRFVKVKN